MPLHSFPTYLLTALLVLVAAVTYSSTSDEIKKRQVELQSLRSQISEFEQQIKKQLQEEKSTLELLDSYDRKATLVRRLIGRLRAQERDLQDTINRTRKEIRKQEDQLSFLKKHYGRYITSVYKSGHIHDLELLLSSRSINQFYIRAEYLKRFSTQRKKDADKITHKKAELEESQAKLQQQLSEERRVIAEKAAEEDKLVALVADRKDALLQIRKDKKSIQRELNRRLQSARELENLITELIEQDRLRKEREAAERERTGGLPQPPPVAGAFETRKGRLRWPISEGAVVAKFGNQKHPTLKTITQNTGIDIAVKAGSQVTAVAEGDVATIWWLPSYGNIVIIDHYGGYRTVYSHLADINVTQGQKIPEGHIIGTSGESLDGPRLHFELWKDREKQNPELWLGKK